MKKLALALLILLSLSLLVGCGQVSEDRSAYQGDPTAAPAPDEAKEGEGEPYADWPAEARPLIEAAVADLRTVARSAGTEVEVLSVEAVEWPDGCLGCPQEGEMCVMAITPGYRILLELDGRTYEYRTSHDSVRYCPAEDAETGVDEEANEVNQTDALVEGVTDDLAKRLDIESVEIQVVQVEEVQWRDSSLGCPQEGEMYLQVITPGFRIVLEAQGQQYEYHTDSGGRFVLCSEP